MDAPQANSLRGRLITAFVDGLTWLVERNSLAASSRFARGFGRLWVHAAGPRTRRVRTELRRAFPDRSEPEIEVWTQGVFEHLASGIVELLALRGARAVELLDRVDLEGLEHLQAAEAESRTGGVLVVTGHIGNWELACAKVASLGIPVSVVYRGLREPALDQILFDLRSRRSASSSAGSASDEEKADAFGVQQIRMGHAGLPVVRALEAGRKVITLLDQDAKREEGVFVSFFGRPASTRSGPIELAMARGVPIVPAFIHRLDDGERHRIEIGPAFPLEMPLEVDSENSGGASDDGESWVVRANTQRVTSAIEEAIRAFPSQWIWTHRRWKTQPEGTSAGTKNAH